MIHFLHFFNNLTVFLATPGTKMVFIAEFVLKYPLVIFLIICTCSVAILFPKTPKLLKILFLLVLYPFSELLSYSLWQIFPVLVYRLPQWIGQLASSVLVYLPIYFLSLIIFLPNKNQRKHVTIVTLCFLILCCLSLLASQQQEKEQEQSDMRDNLLFQKQHTYPTPTPAQESMLPSGALAYTKAGDVYIEDTSGKKQLTHNSKGKTSTAYIKWSKDGKYLGWITRKDYLALPYRDYPDDPSEHAGYSISILNMQTGALKTVVTITDTSFFGKNIRGFDFSNDDSQIIFANQSLWSVSITDGNVQKLNTGRFPQNDQEKFTDVQWSPTQPIVLGTQYGGYSYTFDLYNASQATDSTVEVVPPKSLSTANIFNEIWLPNGYMLLGWGNANGMGLWEINSQTKAVTTVLDPKLNLSIAEAAVSPSGTIAGIISKDVSKDGYPSHEGNAVYTVFSDGNIIPLTYTEKGNFDINSLAWSPDGKYITYFSSSDGFRVSDQLHIMLNNGSNNQILLSNVTSYAWRPL